MIPEGYNQEFIWDDLENGISRIALRQTILISVDIGLDDPVCIEKVEEYVFFVGKDIIAY